MHVHFTKRGESTPPIVTFIGLSAPLYNRHRHGQSVYVYAFTFSATLFLERYLCHLVRARWMHITPCRQRRRLQPAQHLVGHKGRLIFVWIKHEAGYSHSFPPFCGAHVTSLATEQSTRATIKESHTKRSLSRIACNLENQYVRLLSTSPPLILEYVAHKCLFSV